MCLSGQLALKVCLVASSKRDRDEWAWAVEVAPAASYLGTYLTRNTRAPHFTPQHWLLCHMGLY